MMKYRQPSKKQKKLIQSMKITKELLVKIIYSLNSNAKSLQITSKERNDSITSKRVLLERELYEAKTFLLNLFFKAKEVHVFEKGGEFLYYPVSPYTGFHIPCNTKNTLKRVRIDRDKTPKLKSLPIYEIEFCLWVARLGEKLTIV